MSSANNPASLPAKTPWPLWLALFAGWTGLGLALAGAAQVCLLLLIRSFIGSFFDIAALIIMAFMALWWLLLTPAVAGLVKLIRRDEKALFWLRLHALISFLAAWVMGLNLALRSGVMIWSSDAGVIGELMGELSVYLLRSLPDHFRTLPFMAATYLAAFLYLKKSPAAAAFFRPPASPPQGTPIAHGAGLTAWFLLFAALYYFETLVFVVALGLGEQWARPPLAGWGEFFSLAAGALIRAETWAGLLAEFGEIFYLMPALIAGSLAALFGLNRRGRPGRILTWAGLLIMAGIFVYLKDFFWLVPTLAALAWSFSPAWRAGPSR